MKKNLSVLKFRTHYRARDTQSSNLVMFILKMTLAHSAFKFVRFISRCALSILPC